MFRTFVYNIAQKLVLTDRGRTQQNDATRTYDAETSHLRHDECRALCQAACEPMMVTQCCEVMADCSYQHQHHRQQQQQQQLQSVAMPCQALLAADQIACLLDLHNMPTHLALTVSMCTKYNN